MYILYTEHYQVLSKFHLHNEPAEFVFYTLSSPLLAARTHSLFLSVLFLHVNTLLQLLRFSYVQVKSLFNCYAPDSFSFLICFKFLFFHKTLFSLLTIKSVQNLYSETSLWQTPWGLEKVSTMKRCPLCRGLTFFSKEMTFRSFSG